MAGRGLAHGFDGGLVGEEVAAVDGVVEVLVGGVAFALQILGGVDAALGADRVGTLDRDDGKQVDGAAGFGDLDDRGEAGQASANHDDSGCCHERTFQRSGVRDQRSEPVLLAMIDSFKSNRRSFDCVGRKDAQLRSG